MKTKLVAIVILIYMGAFGQDRKQTFPIGTFYGADTDIYGISVGTGLKYFNHMPENETLTRTYGMRIEAPGLGLLYFIAPNSYIKGGATEESIIEEIYGFNISGGSLEHIKVNGFSGAVGGQYLQILNGVVIAGFGNSVEELKGVSVAFMLNEVHEGVGISAALGNWAEYYKGIQIGGSNHIVEMGVGMQMGIYNKSFNHIGLQLGLWNHLDPEEGEFKGIQIGILNKTSKLRGIQFGLWNKNERRSLPFINWQFSKKKVKSKES